MTLEHRPGTAVIELSSGEQLDLRNPDPKLITVNVVGHHLANVCRFAGAVRRPYSVAEHCLLVAAYLYYKEFPPHVVLSGLHHDDAEFILGDMTRPLKERIVEFKPIEKEFMGTIADALDFERWGIQPELPEVKEADNWALAAEAFHLMPTQGREWWSWGIYQDDTAFAKLPEVQRLRMTQLGHGTVRNLWVAKHAELCYEIMKIKPMVANG